MSAILGVLFKALMEVLSDALVKILSRPDVVAPEVKPIFAELETGSSNDLLDRFAGVLDQPGSDLLQGNAAP